MGDPASLCRGSQKPGNWPVPQLSLVFQPFPVWGCQEKFCSSMGACGSPDSKTIRVLLLGLDGAGKATLMYHAAKDGRDHQDRPYMRRGA